MKSSPSTSTSFLPRRMNEEIYLGKVGINAVTESLSQIDSASAKASNPQDEDRGALQQFSKFLGSFRIFFPKQCVHT